MTTGADEFLVPAFSNVLLQYVKFFLCNRMAGVFIVADIHIDLQIEVFVGRVAVTLKAEYDKQEED
jgi:hypothetical protein